MRWSSYATRGGYKIDQTRPDYADRAAHAKAIAVMWAIITVPLTSLIVDQSSQFSVDVLLRQREAKLDVQQDRRSFFKSEAKSVLWELSGDLHLTILLAQEKGASSWLTSLPILEHGHALHKSALRDALAFHYGWIPSAMPSECVCGEGFSVKHALFCYRGGFPTLRHNNIQELTASLVSEVCSNVAVEPELQQLTGEKLQGSAANRRWVLGPREGENFFRYLFFLPHMLLQTRSLHCHRHTEGMRTRRRGRTINTLMKWNSARLHL